MSLVIRSKTVEADALTPTDTTMYKYLKYKKDHPNLNEIHQVGTCHRLYAHRCFASRCGVDITAIKEYEKESFNMFISMVRNIKIEANTVQEMVNVINDLANVFKISYDALDEQDKYLVCMAVDTYDIYLCDTFVRLVKSVLPHELYIFIDEFRNDIGEALNIFVSQDTYTQYVDNIIGGLYEMVVNIIKGLSDNNVEANFYHSDYDDVLIKVMLPVYTEIVYFTSFSIRGLYGEDVNDIGPGLHVIKTGNPKYKHYEPLLDVKIHGREATQFLLYANNTYRENRTVDVFIDRRTGNIILFA